MRIPVRLNAPLYRSFPRPAHARVAGMSGALIMPARARADARGFTKLPLEFHLGRSVLQFVRHLAQFAGNAEVEARLRQAAAAFCQLDEKFDVGHARAIPAAGENLRCRNVPHAAPANLAALASVQPR